MTKNQQHSTQTKRGPIADSILRLMTSHLNSNVIDFNAWKTAKLHQEQLEKRDQKDLSDLDPLHAIYIDAQHRLADFIEQISALPQLEKLNKFANNAEAMYDSPAGPPMTPLTRSFFYSWLALDMAVGLAKETFCSIMIECYQFLKVDSLLIQVLEHMQYSRMGLYIHEGDRDGYVYFRELYTNKLIKTHVCSGYSGFPGELWFTRLLSDPISGHLDYSIHFTTPYVIIDQPRGKVWHSPEEIMPCEKTWIEFIERSLKKTKQKNKEKALYHFMKYGLSKYYWTEYIFQGYVNYRQDMIWLTGFPDQPESLPHASESHAKWLNV